MPMTIATSANPISMSQAITDLIEIHCTGRKTALSHILHAESEKLHKAINMGEVTLEEIMNVNDTVMSMGEHHQRIRAHAARYSWSLSPTISTTPRAKARAPEAPAEMGMRPPPAASAAAGGQPSKRKRAGRVNTGRPFCLAWQFCSMPRRGRFFLPGPFFSRNRPPFQKHAA